MRYAVCTTASTPCIASATPSESHTSTRIHAPDDGGKRSNHVPRTLQPRAGARASTSRPRYPHPPVTSNRCIADESLRPRETHVTESPSDRWPRPDGETVVIDRTNDTLVGGEPPAVAPRPVGPPPDRRIGAGMLLALGAILLVLAGIALAWFLAHRDSNKQTTTVVVTTAPVGPGAAAKVAVPRVVGMKEQAALVALSQVGLRPKEVFKPTKQPKNLVVSQSPQEAKTVRKGSQVTLVIDSGAPRVAVPDVGGQSLSEAQAALDKQGLDSTVTQVTSDQPAGTIVDQAPKPGAKLAKGSAVTLSVSKQSQTTTPTTTSQQTTTAAAPPQPQNAPMPDVT